MLVRHEPTSVAAVRREIAEDLMNNGVQQDRVEDVALVASELVGNAVRHTEHGPDGDLDVAWTVTTTTVLVSVSDASAAEPRMRIPTTNEPAGRGLSIVDALASKWGVERLRHGKRVWARVPIR
jgi:anti-sigma regulatory factor (Ser/Thr protein kinase)